MYKKTDFPLFEPNLIAHALVTAKTFSSQKNVTG
jgi:hypothetical protein